MRRVLASVLFLIVHQLLLAQKAEIEHSPIELDADIEFVKVYNGQTRVDVHIFEKGDPTKPVEDVLCNLFLSHVSKGGMMGSLITDKDGFCSFVMVNKYEVAKDTIDYYYFICRIQNDVRFKPVNIYQKFYKADADILFQRDKKTGDKRITGVLTGLDEQKSSVSIPQAEVNFFAKTREGTAKINKHSIKTDEEGKFSYLFDSHFQKNDLGQLDLMVSLKHPEYGTVEYWEITDWGVGEEEIQNYKDKAHVRNRLIAIGIGVIILLMIGIGYLRKTKSRINS